MRAIRHTRMDYLRLPLAVLAFIIQFPFMVLFYLLRSAWTDAPRVAWFLQHSFICQHGVDRVRVTCLRCDRADALDEQAQRDQQFSDAVHGEIRDNIDAARRARGN